MVLTTGYEDHWAAAAWDDEAESWDWNEPSWENGHDIFLEELSAVDGSGWPLALEDGTVDGRPLPAETAAGTSLIDGLEHPEIAEAATAFAAQARTFQEARKLLNDVRMARGYFPVVGIAAVPATSGQSKGKGGGKT